MSEIEEVEKVEEEKKPKDLKVCSSSFHFVATLLVTFFITCCYFVRKLTHRILWKDTATLRMS